MLMIIIIIIIIIIIYPYWSRSYQRLRKMFKPFPYTFLVRSYVSHKILSDKMFWYSLWRVRSDKSQVINPKNIVWYSVNDVYSNNIWKTRTDSSIKDKFQVFKFKKYKLIFFTQTIHCMAVTVLGIWRLSCEL
jgi:hypothetical protein